MGGGLKYVDDLIRGIADLGRTTGSHADDFAKLSDNAASFFADIQNVTRRDIDRWLREAQGKEEFAGLLGTKALREQVSGIAIRSLHRTDFSTQITSKFRRLGGNLSDSEIETLSRTHGLDPNDAFVREMYIIRDELKRAGNFGTEAGAGARRVDPTLRDEVGDVGNNAGRTEPHLGDEGATLGDEAGDAGSNARRTEQNLGDEAGDAAAHGDEARGGAGVADETVEAAERGGVVGGRRVGPRGHMEGRILAVRHEHWAHRLASFHPSTIFERIPIIGKMFSLGNVKDGLPNLGVVDRFIRPAVRHIDDTIKNSGLAEQVIDLQAGFKALTDDIAAGRVGVDQAKQKIDELFSGFANNADNMRLIDNSIAQVERLQAELADGLSVLEGKYTGLTGLNDRQAHSMKLWLEDMHDTLSGLKRGEGGTVELAEKYKAVLDTLVKDSRERRVYAETFGNMIDSRLGRVGENVRMRIENNVTRKVTQLNGTVEEVTSPALTHNTAALERQIDGGAYNQFDHAHRIINARAQNVEMNMFKMLNQYKFRQAGGQWDVDASQAWLGWMDEFYASGLEHDVNRIVRVLKAKMGGQGLQTIPQSLVDRINQELRATTLTPHRRRWLESVKEAIADNKDRGTALGAREIERRFYSPFAEFWTIAKGYPMPKGAGNFFTGFAVPTVDNYMRIPMWNGAKRGWAWLTGGRTVSPSGYAVGDEVVDASHSARKFKYDWWFRKAPTGEDGASMATNTGLLGRGTDRSLFGVLGKDGYLDRMPWYLKMPLRLGSGGMVSTESRIGLTLPGKVLVGGALVTVGIEKGTAALGWNGFNDEPGLQVPWVDPRDPIHALQRAGLGFYDFWWDDVLGTATRPIHGIVTGGRDWSEIGSVDIDSIHVPFTDMNVRNWVLSWTDTSMAAARTEEEREVVRQVTDDMRRRAQIVINESPGHVADIANFFESSEQLMEKLRQEAEAARTAGDNEKATKLDQLRQQLTTDHTAMAAYMNGVVAKQAEQQAALDAFQRAGDALAAEEALLVLESTNNDLRQMNAQSRQVYEGMRTKIGAVPEAAAVLGTVAAPAPVVANPNAGVTGGPNAGVTGGPNAGVTGDPNAGGQRQQGPTFIGPQGGGSESTTTGTPEEQLAAIKREAARAARNAQQSVNSANEAANYMNDTVRQILELQEYARDNGGRPGEFDAPLAEARRLQQEAQIAAQEAQEKQRQTDQLLANVNGATVATIGDARAKLQTMQDNARQARQAQQRAAQTNARMQEILRTNTQLDEMLYRRRQDERTRNITGFVDGGDNGLLSNLTRDRGQPGGQSFLGQAFNRVGDAFAGVREWWTRDVARYMSRSEGGKMTYQAMNVGLGGLAALLGIGMWNSTIGKWTGTQITGGMKWLVVGAVLLYMLRGTSGTGDRLDKMAGRYRATSDDYTTAGASGASPFRAGTLSVDTVNGGTRDVNIPDRAGARTLSHEEDRVFRSTVDNARREANMQGTGGALPAETGEVYHRAITVRNADGKVLGSDVIDFRIGGAQQELAPAH